jgi:hypothetical protein
MFDIKLSLPDEALVACPAALAAELAEGRVRGLALPDPTLLPWVRVRVMANTAGSTPRRAPQ